MHDNLTSDSKPLHSQNSHPMVEPTQNALKVTISDHTISLVLLLLHLTPGP